MPQSRMRKIESTQFTGEFPGETVRRNHNIRNVLSGSANMQSATRLLSKDSTNPQKMAKS